MDFEILRCRRNGDDFSLWRSVLRASNSGLSQALIQSIDILRISVFGGISTCERYDENATLLGHQGDVADCGPGFAFAIRHHPDRAYRSVDEAGTEYRVTDSSLAAQ